MKHEGWAARLPQGIDQVQVDLLGRFERLLRERAVPLGSIAESDVSRIGERHILDSLRALPLLAETGGTVIDLGSGAGLPGIPIAIARPDLEVVLAEARSRRAAFLEVAVEELGLPRVRVHAGQAERLGAIADVCLARALAKPVRAWRVAASCLRPGGRLICWLGVGANTALGIPGVHVDLFDDLFDGRGLAKAGPLAIMTRQ